jgi:hypothetical protein
MNKYIFHSRTNPRVTVVALVDSENRAHYGVARVSNSDHFSKKKGVLIASQRAKQHTIDISEDFNVSEFKEKAAMLAKNIAENPQKINGRPYVKSLRK